MLVLVGIASAITQMVKMCKVCQRWHIIWCKTCRVWCYIWEVWLRLTSSCFLLFRICGLTSCLTYWGYWLLLTYSRVTGHLTSTHSFLSVMWFSTSRASKLLTPLPFILSDTCIPSSRTTSSFTRRYLRQPENVSQLCNNNQFFNHRWLIVIVIIIIVFI